MICARFSTRRSMTPAGGASTASSASPAFDDATRWLTGQMPQIRAMRAGISWKGRPSHSFSKPRNWVTCKCASETAPASSSWMVIAAWPSMRVTGSMVIWRTMLTSTAESRDLRQVGRLAGQHASQEPIDDVGRRRAAGKKDVDRNHEVDGPDAREERGHAGPGEPRFEVHVFGEGPRQNGVHREEVSIGRHVPVDGAIAERDDDSAPLTHGPNHGEIVLCPNRSLDEGHVNAVGELLHVDERAEDEVEPLRDLDQPLVQVEEGHVASGAAVEPHGGEARTARRCPGRGRHQSTPRMRRRF